MRLTTRSSVQRSCHSLVNATESALSSLGWNRNYLAAKTAEIVTDSAGRQHFSAMSGSQVKGFFERASMRLLVWERLLLAMPVRGRIAFVLAMLNEYGLLYQWVDLLQKIENASPELCDLRKFDPSICNGKAFKSGILRVWLVLHFGIGQKDEVNVVRIDPRRPNVFIGGNCYAIPGLCYIDSGEEGEKSFQVPWLTALRREPSQLVQSPVINATVQATRDVGWTQQQVEILSSIPEAKFSSLKRTGSGNFLTWQSIVSRLPPIGKLCLAFHLLENLDSLGSAIRILDYLASGSVEYPVKRTENLVPDANLVAIWLRTQGVQFDHLDCSGYAVDTDGNRHPIPSVCLYDKFCQDRIV